MAQISDMSPHRGCKQTHGKEAVSLTRCELQHFNTSKVHMNTQWSLWEGGGVMVENHVPLQQKWYVTDLDGMHCITMSNKG